ncbi:MAG: hypothetical protein MZV64_32140 [Ignavibacteriales bacterium]|nr:hypothetical protein [Ignavibacteriales bacterium]
MIKKGKPKKVLILGSGALQIGQAGEFDYSGSAGDQSPEGRWNRHLFLSIQTLQQFKHQKTLQTKFISFQSQLNLLKELLRKNNRIVSCSNLEDKLLLMLEFDLFDKGILRKA